jgi:intein/homing endonuclease
MVKFGIITSNTPSLVVVGKDIAYTLAKLGHETKFFSKQIQWYNAKKEFERGIVFIPFDPLYCQGWFLLAWNYNNFGLPSEIYCTTEGEPKKWLIREWVRRDCMFIANSKFTERMLKRVDINVTKVVYHGVNFDTINRVKPQAQILKQQLKQELGVKVLFGTVASGHARKGMKGFAENLKTIAPKIADAGFYVLTTPTMTTSFTDIKNVKPSPKFGKLDREEILTLIGSFDFLIHPALCEGFCTIPETLIITYDGVKPISEVCEGEPVLTHKGRFRKVTKVYKRCYKGKLIGITPRKLERTLWVTPEHPVLVARKRWTWAHPDKYDDYLPVYKPDWIPASMLRNNKYTGHVVLTPKVKDFDVEINSKNYLKNSVEIDGYLYSLSRNQFGATFLHPNAKPVPAKINPPNDFLRLAGYYIAEGCSSKDGIHLAFSSVEKNFIKETMKIAEKYGLHTRCREMNRHRSLTTIGGRLWGTFFGNLFGKNSHEKQIPPFLLGLPKYKLDILWSYMFKGDGYTNVTGVKEYSTVSEKLALTAFLMLFKLGYQPNLMDETKYNHGYVVTYTPKPKFHRAYSTEEYLYLPIKTIETKHYDGYVYNLEVEEDNSYVAEGISVHNCLPVLEAQSLGVPCIFPAYDPITEIAHPTANFPIKITSEDFQDLGDGILYLCHFFKPEDMAEQIAKAYEIYTCKPDEYQKLSKQVTEHAKNFDICKCYRDFTKT